jgi:hypothetical protein
MFNKGQILTLKGEKWEVQLRYRTATDWMIVLESVKNHRHITVKEKDLKKK